MRLRDQLLPVAMARVAIVAPSSRSRRVMIETAGLGVFEPDPPIQDAAERTATTRTLTVAGIPGVAPRLSETEPDPQVLEAEGRTDLLLGEADLARTRTVAQRTASCEIITGWIPTDAVEMLRDGVAPWGGGVTELPTPRGTMPPTAHREAPRSESLRPLVSTYGTVPYRDIDPTWFAAIAYMVMFGMMFGDVGHGLALVVLGIAASTRHPASLSRLGAASPFLIGAGLASVGFGFLYGEAFGPTGLVPTLWLRPLDEPETLLLSGLVGGSILLSLTFVLGAANRWREGGPPRALYAASGIAGALLFAGGAATIGGLAASTPRLWQVGVVIALVGGVLVFVGLVADAGSGAGGVAQAVVELFDTVLRLGSNVVSFTRLAAFGLTHAVITGVVWDGTVDLWHRSSLVPVMAALALFVVGNLAAFALGALVGAIQALRLEYYEMFSRLFAIEGRPFEPWYLPIERSEKT